MPLRRFLQMLLVLVLLCTTLPSAAQQPAKPTGLASPTTAGEAPLAARDKIDPALLAQLLDAEAASQALDATGGSPARVSYIVHLTESARLDDLARLPDLQERRTQLVERLQRTARTSQAPVLAYLAAQAAAGGVNRYGSFWIFNGLVVESNLGTALALAQRPDVASLEPNHVRQLPQPQVVEAEAEPEAIPWNITKIGADQVWQTLGITGQGIVVANLDTGVDWTHPALQSKYRGYDADDPTASSHDHNWYDPTGAYPTAPGPNVPGLSGYSDHGTHTMGTLVGATATGSEQIGVAPGARWVAVKVFTNAGQSTDEWIHRGFQWCLAPTRLDGSSPDPSLAPDIVSNSWGDDDNPADTVFESDIAMLRAAGILTVFAAGNNGPAAGTVGSPASISGVFAVGATDLYDGIASYSGRGPSPWGEIKPEVSAPGSAVRSAIAGGGYASLSGTSMATPHVAGLAALLWSADRARGAITPLGQSANPTLSITATEALIISTALDLGTPGEDNAYGHGRINAYAAVNSILSVGSVTGTVTDAGTDQPVAGALITLTNATTGGQHTATSGADGTYALNLAQGEYALTASRYGYALASVPDVQVAAAEQTTVDLPLQPLPMGTLRGRVTRSTDGQPIPATVEIVGVPVSTAVDAQGYFTLTVEAGDLTARAMPAQLGYRGQMRAGLTMPADGEVVQDFVLPPAPRLLLVDADAGLFSTAAHYRADLDALLYVYDLHSIVRASSDLPSADKLSGYDLVIWSQPVRSPGYIGAWEALTAYLDEGGRLLISGQDIGFWDAAQGYGLDEYRQYLHAEYVGPDGGLGALTGVPGGALDGLTLHCNTADSAGNQTTPDVVRQGGGLATPLVEAASGGLAGLSADACGYRVAYLSFGLEGVGPSAARQDALERLLGLLAQERPARAVALTLPLTRQMATPGSTASYRLWLANTGQATEQYTLSVESPLWTARVVDPVTLESVTATDELEPCESVELLLQVDVPRSAIVRDLVVSAVRAQSAQGTTASGVVRTGAWGAWTAGPTLPDARQRHAAAAVDCSLVVVGGFLGEAPAATNSVITLDLATGAWSAGAPKPTPAADAGAAVLNGRVYVVGGLDPAASPQTLATVEIYDVAADAWSTGPALPVALSGVAVAAHNGLLYAFGGLTDGAESSAAWALDPASSLWTALAPLPSPVSHASAVSLDGSLYLVGGWPQRTQLLRYDPAGDAWTTLTPMHTGRQGAAAVAAEGMLYVAGGGVAWSGLGSAERYDPATDDWEALPELLSAERAGTDGVYAEGRFYVLGGADANATAVVEYLDIAPAFGGSYLAAQAVSVPVGSEVRYDLIVRNPATHTVTVTWAHTLPDALQYVAGSASLGVTWDAPAHALRWSGVLPAAAAMEFGFRATVSTTIADATAITSAVTLRGDGCAATEISATTTAYRPTLAPSTKSVDVATAYAGDTLHYTISVANDSPFTITNASLVDEIPAHTTFVPGTLTGGATYNATRDSVEWLGDIAPAVAPELAYEWVDATGGQALTLTDDACVGPLGLGFEFEFYGNVYDEVYVSSNGMLLFGASSKAYSNVTIPVSSAPNNYVAPLWDDLLPGEGAVYLGTFGQAPQRYAVVEWHGVRTYSDPQPQTFEVLLYEGSNRVLFQYAEMNGAVGAGISATVGIEDATGSSGVQHLYNGAPAEHALHSGLVLEMIHSSTRRTSAHLIEYDVRVDAAVPPRTVVTNIALITDSLGTHERAAVTEIVGADMSASSKTAMPAGVAAGEVVTYTLRLVNTGTAGPDPLFVTDTLPAGLTLEPGSLSAGATYDAVTREICWAGTVWPQDELTLSYAARTDAGLASGVLTNTAVLSFGDVTLERRATVLIHRPGDQVQYLPQMYWQGPRR